MSIRIVRPGLLTTVQDLGRPGYQKDGVTVGGALDAFALRVANLLVGNAESAAGLELTLLGPTVCFEADALLAIGGGRLGPAIDGERIPEWRAIRAQAGATLSFEGAASGCRAYLAVAGGFSVPPVLGSRSTYLRARIGGVAGRALREGDRLALGEPSPLARRIAAGLEGGGASVAVARWTVSAELLPEYRPDPIVRVMRGTHFDRLTPGSREALFTGSFRVLPESDRMGYRLEGPALALAAPLELVSEAVAAGTLQLPPDGQPIALLADRQTTGGYPRIGQIASVELPLVAQTRPGDAIRFREISLREAQSLYLARERGIEQLRRAIRLRLR